MSSNTTQMAQLVAVGLGAIAWLMPSASFASTPAPQHVPNGWVVEKTETNSVGCSKETIVKKPTKGESQIGSFLYDRPADIDVEQLSDAELQGCGLPPLRGIRNLPKTSSAYRSWLKFARGLLGAKQLNLWDVAPLPPGYPPIPPPAGPSAPPAPHFNRHAQDCWSGSGGSAP